MSLSEALRMGKRTLKKTKTVITKIDGRKYIEEGGNLSRMQGTCFGFVVDTKPDDIPVEIVDNLYLGSQDCCETSVLMKYNISDVLSVGVRPEMCPGIQHMFIECMDLPETNILQILEDCTPFMQDAICHQRNILVHCNAGVSRSVAIVTGFLMRAKGLTYEDAFRIVKSGRYCANPNVGFVTQLKMLNAPVP